MITIRSEKPEDFDTIYEINKKVLIIIGTDTYFSWTSLPQSLIILLSLLIFLELTATTTANFFTTCCCCCIGIVILVLFSR
jgi:hypothetical protein